MGAAAGKTKRTHSLSVSNDMVISRELKTGKTSIVSGVSNESVLSKSLSLSSKGTKAVVDKVHDSFKYSNDSGMRTVSVGISAGKVASKGYKGLYAAQSAMLRGVRRKKVGMNVLKSAPKAVIVKGGKSMLRRLEHNDDAGIKAGYYALKGATVSPKVAKFAYKGVRTGVKGVYKTGRGVVKGYKGMRTGIRMARKIGVSKAARLYYKKWSRSLRAKSRKAIAKAGKSIVTAVFNLIKSIAGKMLVPIIVVVVILFVLVFILFGAVAVVASAFSPMLIFFDTGEEVDETAFLAAKITEKRTALVEEIKDVYMSNLIENGGDFHSVKFFNVFTEGEIELTDENIQSSIYSVQEYIEAIQPVFHTVMLTEYELVATEIEMDFLLEEMWSTLNVVETEELPTEYCSMTTDGQGNIIPLLEADGVCHADVSICPNYGEKLFHSDDGNGVLASCDYGYYVCQGHRGTQITCGKTPHPYHTDACRILWCTQPEHYGCSPSTCGWYLGTMCSAYHVHQRECYDYLCGGQTHSHTDACYTSTSHGTITYNCGNSIAHRGCYGYYECKGHETLSVTVSLKSFGDLLDKYFIDEIELLRATEDKTVEQEQRLNSLVDGYEMCLSYLEVLEEEYGYGDGAEIVPLDGVELTDLTEYACSFIGNPYIWGGNDPHTGADCSGFVKYVYADFGIDMYRVSRQQVTQGTLVESIADAQAGDLLFFSDDGTDSGVYHVAIYLGNGKMVHASNSRPYPSGGIKVNNVYTNIYKIKRVY